MKSPFFGFVGHGEPMTEMKKESQERRKETPEKEGSMRSVEGPGAQNQTGDSGTGAVCWLGLLHTFTGRRFWPSAGAGGPPLK